MVIQEVLKTIRHLRCALHVVTPILATSRKR